MEQEPAAAPAAPTVLILNGPADRVAADYETAIKALRAINVAADNWTPADINAIPLMTKQFVKMIKILTSIPDVNLRKDVLMLGFANGFFNQGDGVEKATLTVTITAAALYRFCKWLKTERGATEMKNLHYRRKLARKQIPGATLEETALVSALMMMIEERSIRAKRIKDHYQGQIDDLNRKIMQLQRTLEEDEIRQIDGGRR